MGKKLWEPNYGENFDRESVPFKSDLVTQCKSITEILPVFIDIRSDRRVALILRLTGKMQNQDKNQKSCELYDNGIVEYG